MDLGFLLRQSLQNGCQSPKNVAQRIWSRLNTVFGDRIELSVSTVAKGDSMAIMVRSLPGSPKFERNYIVPTTDVNRYDLPPHDYNTLFSLYRENETPNLDCQETKLGV